MSLRTLWIANFNGKEYRLELDFDDRFCIYEDGKIILRYFDKSKMWIGYKNGKVIKIHWPTFKDIIQNYLNGVNNGE
jgi:hypothetical protein